jgi:hypothetical protein
VDHEDAAKHMAMSETAGKACSVAIWKPQPPSVQKVGLWRNVS